MSRSLGPAYRVPSHLADTVITHRYIREEEQYLVQWKRQSSREPVLSWHNLNELYPVLHLVQEYVNIARKSPRPPPLLPHNSSKKRKRDDDSESSHSLSAESVPSPIALSAGSSLSTSPSALNDFTTSSSSHEVYNGVLRRKGGFFEPREMLGPTSTRMSTHDLPNAAMLSTASITSVHDALTHIRNKFARELALLPGPRVRFENLHDFDTPSLSFRWLNDYVLGEGIPERDNDAIEGCAKCKPDMGAQRGCEYTQKCGCLEFAAPDPQKLRNEREQEIYEEYLKDSSIDTTGLPKRFPYTSTGSRAGCLEGFYLNSRYMIYECNINCKCGPRCKTRNVQKGRKVALEIFKTAGPSRGFGLRCAQPLQRGQFIDKYVGELITDEEANRREAAGGPGKASYLFSLNKFVAEDGVAGGLREEDSYVADGEVMGGPSRFINHSCEPNCRLFTVSYNKNDQYVYDLAFFALYDIPAGEELTFDYMDPEPDEDKTQALQNRDNKLRELEAQGKQRVACHCGAQNCRGYMWE